MFISFFLVLVIAAAVSVYTTRKQSKTSVGHYMGSRSLNFWMVGCSLFLTNMSANQFVGENEFVYTNNMTVMCWGMSSILAMIIVSEFLMPVYLRIGAMTTPDFLGIRFDKQTQRFVSIIFLLSYAINLVPAVLYGCAVAMNGIFQFDTRFGLDYFTTIRLLVTFIGVTGCLYAVLGGLKAITINDIVQGIGMVAGGILITWIGLRFLGDGSLTAGVEKLLGNNREHLNAIGKPGAAIPFGTLFTGMLLINIYYWGMEQYIVQQSLAARNLAESQKGISLACVGKLIAPLLLNVPGLIALQLYPGMENTAQVFPKMITGTLPPLITGLIAAIVFGGALSTFNAGLNSIGTLFTMNLYKPWLEKRKYPVHDATLIKKGRMIQIAITLIAIVFSPYIMFFSGGFYSYLQKVASYFSVPVFTIMLMGLVTRRVPAIAAKAGLFFFVLAYIVTQVVIDTGWHYLHILAVLFVVTSLLMLLIGKLMPREKPFSIETHAKVNLNPWKQRYIYYIILIALMTGMFFLFSPLGIAR
ncbi:solute:sodium symporter family transporter [Niabella yanshanensis]|uniref:Solute:sodium symporter family transporter n=1 Tax=Niabella yanshanensis TaxID=577386 RepID=A0ABZ0W7E7_9BACT|nr:solute:sodium symporter family transporter [Niabella yanshanensis]WQD38040.1 solute:sodium symporter family transporter [Niabella yanshanensis]